jgi:hypothetical protein
MNWLKARNPKFESVSEVRRNMTKDGCSQLPE